METSPPRATGLRERTRHVVRAELMAVGWELFATYGYEETTVERIATTTGMSKRSFFRYFASKDDLLLSSLEQHGQSVAHALARRPADESAWTALRRSFDDLVAELEATPARSRSLLRMLMRTPSLRASHLEKQRRWQDLLTPLVAGRLPRPDDAPVLDGRPGDSTHPGDPRPAAIAGAAVACLDAAQIAWLAQSGQSLAVLLDQAMEAVIPQSCSPAALVPGPGMPGTSMSG